MSDGITSHGDAVARGGIDLAVAVVDGLISANRDSNDTFFRSLHETQVAGLRIALDVVRGVRDGDRLTIRDRFAAYALTGLYAETTTPAHELAHASYMQADAMIAERQKVSGE
jgi:hypothetical protein